MRIAMLKISLNPLNEAEKGILFSLTPFFKQKGLLSGGTSLMLQIPFRKSYGFDLFFPFEIPLSFPRKAASIFNSKIEVLINTSDELTFTAHNQTKVSFIFFPFKRKYKPASAENSISL